MNATNRIFIILGCIALVAAVVLSAANLYWGSLNQDEGWYLYAAGLVASGQWPYIDFAFTQGPVMPLVYAVFHPIVAAGGLAAGRLLTALFGLVAAVLAARLAWRLASAELRFGAALSSFILIGVNVYQSYFCTVVKTYSLTALLLVGGLLALAEGWLRHRTWLVAVAGALMTLAAATRTSAGIVLPLVFLFLLLSRCSARPTPCTPAQPAQARPEAPPLAWLHFGLGAMLMFVLIIMPFLVLAPDSFLYCAMKYHALRHYDGGLMAWVYKTGFLSRLLQAYFVAFLLGIAVLVAKWAMERSRAAAPQSSAPAGTPVLLRILWSSVIAITLIHFLAPFPYDDYQVFAFPMLAIAIVNAAVRLVGQRGILPLTIGLLVVSLAASVSSPINQDWFIQGRDRIWWLVRDRSPLQKLRDTAALIKSMAKPGDLLLTQDPYLAVESNLKLPRGLEMGQFSYFPGLSDRQAAALHVFNRAGFENLLRTTEAPIAALSGYALAIQSPDVTPVPPEDQALFTRIITDRYAYVTNAPFFGQADTTLRILQKKVRE